jgi:hypothetical protein
VCVTKKEGKQFVSNCKASSIKATEHQTAANFHIKNVARTSYENHFLIEIYAMGHKGSAYSNSLSMIPTSHLCDNYINDIIFLTSIDHFPGSQYATFPNAHLGSESLDNKKKQ